VHGRATVSRTPRLSRAAAAPALARTSLRIVTALLALVVAEAAHAQFTSQPVTTAFAGQQYVYEVAANNARGSTIITAPLGLPVWLTLDARGNGTATLSGTPTQVNSVWRVTLRAENGACGFVFLPCPVQIFDITVQPRPNSPPVVGGSGIADQSAEVGTPFQLDLAALFTDSNGDRLTLTATGLPPSFALSGAVISGTPTAADLAGSPYNVTVRAEDGFGGAVADAFLLTITMNHAPTVVAPGIPDQRLTENDALTLDVAASFTDSDGNPLVFSATGLPVGFSLTGATISGTATAASVASSPYNVAVTADDRRGGTVTDAFVLTIVALARADVFLSSIVATPSPVTRGTAVEWVVTVGNSGPSPSGSVALTMEFRGNPFTFTSNSCTLSNDADRQRLSCTVGAVASGGTQTVKVAGSAAQPGDIYVTAAINAAAAVPVDPDPSNNSKVSALNVAETIVASPAQALGNGADALVAGDSNRDGFSDVVAVSSDEPPALWLDIDNPTALDASLVQPGDARRGLASVPLSLGSRAGGVDVALADFDNDQDIDVAVASGAGAESVALRNDGNGTFAQLALLGPAARVDRAIAAADMNGDRFADVVIASATGNFLYVNQNGSTFAPPAALPNVGGTGAVGVVLADIVGSPLPDLVLVNVNGTTVRYENLGGSFGAAVTVDQGPSVGAASADFNRDNRADLVLARSASGPSGVPSNPVYLNNNSGGLLAVAALGASPTAAVLAADVDGDGASDVIAINLTGAHRVFLNDGNGNFRMHPRVLVSKGARRGALGAFGRLQRPDLVLAGPDALHVFFNDGRGGLGLGDTTRPVIQLVGNAQLSMEVGTPFADPGATATDDVDGPVTPTITNPVNVDVIGTYTVTYGATDKAGNAAVPVTRTVTINAKEGQGGGGGGATGLSSVVSLLVAVLLERLRRRRAQAVEAARPLGFGDLAWQPSGRLASIRHEGNPDGTDRWRSKRDFGHNVSVSAYAEEQTREPLTTTELVALARAQLTTSAWDFINGGAETETTLLRNRYALDCIAFRPRVLRNVSATDLSATFIGTKQRLPIVLAPLASLTEIHPEGALPIARAAKEFGCLMFLSSVTRPGIEEISKVAADNVAFQLYTDGDDRWVTDAAKRAADAGCKALCVTVDVPTFGRRERHVHARQAISGRPFGGLRSGEINRGRADWQIIDKIRRTVDVPLILKGIQTAEDATLALQHGVDVIYVSNHGGRQLDHCRGAIDLLPEIVSAARGKAEIVVDGGFMRGTDILKGIAKGASMVGIGRLVALALGAAGEAGVLRLLELLETELRVTMKLLGVNRCVELDGTYIQPAPSVTPPGLLSAFPLLDAR
jgi:glycolate oxidase